MDSIQGYYNYDVVTNININREKNSLFPTISFCLDWPSYTDSFENLLLNCSFDKRICNYTDFEYFKDYLNNTCYRFNSGLNIYNKIIPIKNLTRNTPDTGLVVRLQLDNYQRNLGGKKVSPFQMNVFIQNYSTLFSRIPFYNYEAGIPVQAGLNYIQVEKELILNLPQPYNECIKQDTTIELISDLFQYFIQNNKTYLKKDCFDLCLKEYMKKECNCGEKIGIVSECLLDINIYLCLSDLFNRFYSKTKELPNASSVKCSLECEFYNYRILINI